MIGQLFPVDDMKVDFIVRFANQLSYFRRWQDYHRIVAEPREDEWKVVLRVLQCLRWRNRSFSLNECTVPFHTRPPRSHACVG